MEWVETTGRTVEEAKNLALDQLGIDEADAEIEVLDEPRAGLFGRQRGEARVRARVRPSTPRPKVDRRDRRKAGGERGDAGGSAASQAASGAGQSAPRSNRTSKQGSARPGPKADTPGQTASGSRQSAAPTATKKESNVDAQQVGDEASRFVDGLVTAFGLEATTAVDVQGDEIEVKVSGADLGLLVGPRGSTLQAVQELTRVVAQRRLGDHDTHLRVDVGGYRERRREALSRFAQQVAEQVVAEGVAKRLEPMSSPDRKVVHDVLAEFEGVVTSSVGEEPNRRVVISPANG
jgi:spoIIIJ-associated protein